VFSRLARSDFALSVAGFALASFYWLIGATNRRVLPAEPDFYAVFADDKPCIIALWHGEHFLVPFMKVLPLNILITTHRDGEVLARGCGWYGLNCIRGSGDSGGEFLRKKALRAFSGMLRVLRKGEKVVMTADVPKVSRVAGLGIVTLAKHAGCAIVPVALATSRYRRLENWDRTCINMPFGRMIFVRGEPISVPADADDAALERARHEVETALNAATERAYALVGQGGDARPYSSFSVVK